LRRLIPNAEFLIIRDFKKFGQSHTHASGPTHFITPLPFLLFSLCTILATPGIRLFQGERRRRSGAAVDFASSSGVVDGGERRVARRRAPRAERWSGRRGAVQREGAAAGSVLTEERRGGEARRRRRCSAARAYGGGGPARQRTVQVSGFFFSKKISQFFSYDFLFVLDAKSFYPSFSFRFGCKKKLFKLFFVLSV